MMESSCLRSNFKTFFENIYQIESLKIKVIKENMHIRITRTFLLN